jgi:hypothetical protein
MKAGQRVTAGSESGYIYVIEHDWAGLVLDKNAHRNNAPIYWARLTELKDEA